MILGDQKIAEEIEHSLPKVTININEIRLAVVLNSEIMLGVFKLKLIRLLIVLHNSAFSLIILNSHKNILETLTFFSYEDLSNLVA